MISDNDIDIEIIVPAHFKKNYAVLRCRLLNPPILSSTDVGWADPIISQYIFHEFMIDSGGHPGWKISQWDLYPVLNYYGVIPDSLDYKVFANTLETRLYCALLKGM
jgi:hypothetical protein